MHSALTSLWQLIKTAYLGDQESVPLEDLRRIAYELDAELKPAQEDLVVLTPYQKNGQTEFAEIGTSFWNQQNLHVTLHAVPLGGTLILRLPVPPPPVPPPPPESTMRVHRCPHAGCTFAGLPAEMFEHFAEGWRHREQHGQTSSAARQVALAIGIAAKEYERGFRLRAGEFTAGGLRVEVRAARVAPAAPDRRRKSSAHRIYVECPVCPGVLVSAGRLHQHKHRAQVA